MYKLYFKMLKHPELFRKMNKIKSKVYKKEAKLQAEYTVDKEPIPFEKRDENLKKIKKCQKWGNVFDCAWFNFKGVVPTSAKGKKVQLMIALDGEGCLFDNEGNPVKGLSNICGLVELFQPSKGKKILDFCDNAVGGEDVNVWVEAGHNKLSINIKNYAIFKQADIVTVREDIKALYYDYFCLFSQFLTLDKQEKAEAIKEKLLQAAKEAKTFDKESVQKAREILLEELKRGEKSELTVYAHGHAHLDLAWLWPIRETKRKLSRTFSNTIYNIENYPEYIFGVSQPQQLEWMKSLYPSLYEKVKDNILKDRIEPQGKMWVECDTNLTGGESLIRQSVYGEKFWQDEFKKSPKMCWLPDVFGFNGNLPQILKKCGMDYFLTIKLSWNKQNKFPYRTFMWEGIDNSSVLAHMPPEGTYNSDATPIALNTAKERNSESDLVKEVSLPFGVGDGGGGAGEGHLECALRQQDIALSPRLKFEGAGKLFEKLEKIKNELPKYKGELYLETHQGTYTTQAKVKYYNRLVEKTLHAVEFLATLANVKKGVEYPYEKLQKIWKELLLYQFHDIIPGSSIKRVYDECVPAYEKMYNELIVMREQLLKKLSQSSSKLCAFNPTSYKRKEYIKHGEKYYLAEVPPYASKKISPADIVKISSMENDYMKLNFGENGEIVSLYHKKLDKEFCKDYLNVLKVYKDKKTHYNAWDIDINYINRPFEQFEFMGSKQFQEGASIIRESIYKYNKSTLTQKVILTMGKEYVEFVNSIEWQETHKMLRAEFAPKFFGEEVTCDIQFGNLKRSAKNQTEEEKAQHEICAHKWVDVSNDGYGISLLNDCKYGHRVKDGVISLNLLRSPMWPAKDADKGVHTFTYALYPHKGDCYEGQTAKMGYSLNNPLIVNRADFDSFVVADKPNIVLETVKLTENRSGEVIIRAYEDQGKETKSAIKIDSEYKKAMLTDMLENEIEKVSLDNLTFTPFEIKTIKVTL